jgi:putative transposase
MQHPCTKIQHVKMTAQLKLLPMPEQAAALKRTLETANAACNYISKVAWQTHTFSKYPLQQLCYPNVKETFNLSAQMVIRCLAKVGDSYKPDRKKHRTYQPLGSIAYDDRMLSHQLDRRTVSLWTVAGRLKHIPFVTGERQWRLLQTRQGETDLVYRNGAFYLLATCTVDEPTPAEVDTALGVDLGIVNLCTDSDGETHSGEAVEPQRQKPFAGSSPQSWTWGASRGRSGTRSVTSGWASRVAAAG